MAGTYSPMPFLKKTPSTEKDKDQLKNVKASLRCHGDSDCNKTQIVKNFHLYIIQLGELFTHILRLSLLMPTLLMLKLGRYPPPKKIRSSHLNKKKSETNKIKNAVLRIWRSSSIRYNSALFCLRFASNSCLQHARVLSSFNLMTYHYFARRLSGSQPSPLLNQWKRGWVGWAREREIPEDLNISFIG